MMGMIALGLERRSVAPDLAFRFVAANKRLDIRPKFIAPLLRPPGFPQNALPAVAAAAAAGTGAVEKINGRARLIRYSINERGPQI